MIADLKSALGKKRRDGKSAPLPPLTKIQRVHVGQLIEKYGDDYQVPSSTNLYVRCRESVIAVTLNAQKLLQAMFMDTGLNAMQHSVATLRKLCQRYYAPTSKFFINSK